MRRKAKLDRYRDQVTAIFNANVQAVLRDPEWTENEKAGTLILIATDAISVAAFHVGSVDPRLKNAPPEAQMADFLDLIGDTLISAPILPRGLRVVPKTEGAKS
jgi:hypothetical protein